MTTLSRPERSSRRCKAGQLDSVRILLFGFFVGRVYVSMVLD